MKDAASPRKEIVVYSLCGYLYTFVFLHASVCVWDIFSVDVNWQTHTQTAHFFFSCTRVFSD